MNNSTLAIVPCYNSQSTIGDVVRDTKKFIKNIIVRNMTIVAGSHTAMRVMGPVHIMRDHNMAVDAGFGFIAEVGLGF